MRKILLIVFLIFNLKLFADDVSSFYLYINDYWDNLYGYYVVDSYVTDKDCSSPELKKYDKLYLCYDNKLYSLKKITSSVNLDCFKYFSQQISANFSGVEVYLLTNSSYYSYCSSYPTCNFSNYSGYFVCNDNNITCPPGQRYDSTQEKCVDIPSCPSDDELKQMAIQKCQSLNFVKTMTCDKNTGKVDIQCKSCSDIINSAVSYCKGLGGYLRDGIYCKDNNGTLSVSFSSLSSDICIQTTCKPGQIAIKSGDSITCVDLNSSDNSPCPEGQIGVQQPDGSYKCSDLNSSTSVCPDGYIGITQDGQTQCVKLDGDNNSVCPEGTLGITQDGKTVCLLMNNTADNSGSSDSDNTAISSNNSGSNSNDSNTSSNKNNNKNSSNSSDKCPDPCQLLHSATPTQEVLISDQCYKIISPVFGKCVLLYHLSYGNCIPGCDDSLNSNEKNLSNISSQLNIANEHLSNIDKTLTDLKNLKPDGNFSVGSPTLDSNTSSLFSDVYKFFENAKSSLKSLKDSYDKISNLLKNPKSFTLFQTENIQSCPLIVKTEHFKFNADICKVVSPYKPILQLFFTLIFSFSVIFYFFDVVLRRD